MPLPLKRKQVVKRFKDGDEEITFTLAKPFEGQRRASDERAQHPAHLSADESKDNRSDSKNAFSFDGRGFPRLVERAGQLRDFVVFRVLLILRFRLMTR